MKEMRKAQRQNVKDSLCFKSLKIINVTDKKKCIVRNNDNMLFHYPMVIAWSVKDATKTKVEITSEKQ